MDQQKIIDIISHFDEFDVEYSILITLKNKDNADIIQKEIRKLGFLCEPLNSPKGLEFRISNSFQK